MKLQFDRKTNALAVSLSAGVQVGRDLWVGGDEGTLLACLRRDGHGGFKVSSSLDLAAILRLPVKPDEQEPPSPAPRSQSKDKSGAARNEPAEWPEIDIEGLDWCDGYLWLVGSHSLKRKKPKSNDAPADALDRLAAVEADGNRCILARLALTVGADGHSTYAGEAAQLDAEPFRNALLEELAEDAHFRRLLPRLKSQRASERHNIPGKDNGVDIEGLAVTEDGRIFAGMRGPVLRGWACVLELKIGVKRRSKSKAKSKGRKIQRLKLEPVSKDGRRYRKHFLALDGLGIRDLCRDGDDLLILAGPTMAIGWPPTLFRWHGAGKTAFTEPTITDGNSGRLTRIALGSYLPAHPGQNNAESLARFAAVPGVGASPGANAGADAQPDADTPAGERSYLVLYDSPSEERLLDDTSVLADLYVPISVGKGVQEIWERRFTSATLEEELWIAFLETVAPASVESGCVAALRHTIYQHAAAAGTRRRGKSSPSAMRETVSAVRHFALALRQEAILRGHPDRIDIETSDALRPRSTVKSSTALGGPPGAKSPTYGAPKSRTR